MTKAGDKCPRCKSGLVVRDEQGFACDECPWSMEITEVVRREKQVSVGNFRSKSFKITIDDPEEGEEFLKGLIVARSNNSSDYFVDLIDAVNMILEPWRAERLALEMTARAEAGMA
jgi:hypothetical protein